MYSTVKIIIPIQSMSDVITNSSSELFCTIFSEKHLDDIYKYLKDLLGYGYYGDSVRVSLRNKDEDEDYYKDYPDNWIEIDVPYIYSDVSNILQVGMQAILKDKFKDNYKIVFE